MIPPALIHAFSYHESRISETLLDVGLYEVLINVLPAVNDCQLSPCVEKQWQEAEHCIAVNCTKSKMNVTHLK